MTIARRYLYETADAVRLDALADGAWPPLAGLVEKLRREERYHAMHIGTWLERLGSADGEPRDRLLAAWTTLGPDAATVFTPLAGEARLVEAGLLDAPMATLDARWRLVIAPTLARLALPAPPAPTDPESGRTAHGADFESLWTGFTRVRRSDPGATW
jgi:ring-1,2-phenylacetyl-CoA epoxidase subunit PaaC